MSDVRALLKAKREEQRINHPFAAYNQSGALRCTVCGTIVKHASAWNGHIGSKSHRTNAARMKEEERLREEEKRHGKRKADEEEEAVDEPAKKRRAQEDEQSMPTSITPASGFPADFFSDLSRSLPIDDADSDVDVDKDNPTLTETTSQSQSALDLEWAKFQEVVINAPVDTDTRETFERATIFAEPQLSTEIPEGFPSSVAPEADTQREASPTPKDDDAERRRRAEEDKELIMDRLLDEERAQEEADERVNILKVKFELLKKKRTAARAAKITQ